jgi:hypothetical protein
MENNDINSLSHNTVQLATASGQLTSLSPYGTSNDPWPGTKGVFAPHDSDSFSGSVSGIVLSGFMFSGLAPSLTLSTNTVSGSVNIAGIFTYPNPAGAGCVPRRPGIITTFALQYTRPPRAMSITIFTIAGEHVKTINSGDINPPNRTQNPDADDKWVYECDWDGRNDSGEPVAPGVYLYKVTADGVNKMGRLAIVR